MINPSIKCTAQGLLVGQALHQKLELQGPVGHGHEQKGDKRRLG